MKGLGKIIIYLLLIIGAIVMLMPFGWMISTSFKLPSEVEKWPPQWGSKNFLPSRDVRVIKDYDEKNLVLVVNDDAFLRGKVYIKFDKSITYAESYPLEPFKNFYENYSSLIGKSPEDFKDAGDFIVYSFNVLNEHLSKTKFRENLINGLGSILTQFKTLERFTNQRVKDDKDRELLNEYFKSVKNEIELVKLEYERYYDTLNRTMLDPEDVEHVVKLSQKILTKVNNFPHLSTRPANLMLNFFKNKVYNKILGLFEPYTAYLHLRKTVLSLQKFSVNVDEIVGRFKTKEEKFKDLEKAFSKNGEFKDIWNELKDKINNDPNRAYELIKDKIMAMKASELDELKKGLDGDPEKASKLLDRFLNLIKKMEDVAYGKDVNVKEFIGNYAALKNAIKNFNAHILEVAKTMEEYKEFYKLEGLKTTLNAILGDVRDIYTDYKGEGDPINVLKRLYFIRAKYVRLLEEAKKLCDSAVNELIILNEEKVPLINSVKVHIFKGKDMTKEDITLALSVHSVNFIDENIKVSVKFTAGEIFKNVFQNYVDAWFAAPFGRYYINTVFVATATTILEVILASMAAFAFAILNFRGRDFLFGLFLATMMVPGEVLLVPNFITITKFGWIDTYYALIVPWIVSVFAIFLIRQHFLTLPRELYDAAKIDGCSNWRYLWTIAVPLSKPVIITGALLKFVGSWNAFLWVLIVTNSEKYRTLPVGLHTFSSEAGTVYNQLMAAATFSVLPVILLFLFVQKYFIRGIARTGLK